MAPVDLRAVLSRLDIFLYTPRQLDGILVPAYGTVTIYPHGATCRTDTSIGSNAQNVPVPVRDLGGTAVGCKVRVGLQNPGGYPLLTVVGTDVNTNTLYVTNTTSFTIPIVASTRLVVLNHPNPPYLYREPLGTDLVPSPFLTSETIGGVTTGRVRAYVLARRYDYVITINSLDSWVLDCEGGFVMRG